MHGESSAIHPCQRSPGQSPDIPVSFINAVAEAKVRVSIYEVAPAESAQRVSTVARAADAIALASSLAGTLPTYGLGAGGNFAFSRSAVGKADALERAPIVVGFAEPAHTITIKKDGETETTKVIPAFGWLLGPKVRLDPEKKRLVLAHYTRPYNLFADLSLPAWWPYIDIDVYSAWAPDWRNAAHGKTVDTEDKGLLLRNVRVPMRHNGADMESLTTVILRSLGQRQIELVNIDGIEPRAVSACDGTVQFQIWGENIWRANSVNVGGKMVTPDSIRLLPDMRGIQVGVDLSKLNLVNRKQINVTVWTPNGRDDHDISLLDARQGKLCSTAPIATTIGGPVINGVTPGQISICDTTPVLTISGENLANVEAIILGGLESKLGPQGFVATSNGKLVQAPFEIAKGSTRFKGLNRVPLVVRTVKGAAVAHIALVAVQCSGQTSGQGSNPTEAPEKTEPKISQISPDTISRCASDPKFAVVGENLGNAKYAYFVDAIGTITKPKPNDGKALDIAFTVKDGATKLLNVKETSFVIMLDKSVIEGKIKIDQSCVQP